jgi:hypothetical protein
MQKLQSRNSECISPSQLAVGVSHLTMAESGDTPSLEVLAAARRARTKDVLASFSSGVVEASAVPQAPVSGEGKAAVSLQSFWRCVCAKRVLGRLLQKKLLKEEEYTLAEERLQVAEGLALVERFVSPCLPLFLHDLDPNFPCSQSCTSSCRD